MKPSVKILTILAACMLLAAAISSLLLYDMLGMEPILFSVGSINLLIIARSFAGIESWALFDKEMHSFRNAQGRSQIWQVVAQASAVLSLIAFVLGAISTVTGSPVMGSFQMAWMTASVNLALLSIVISSSLAKSTPVISD